MNGGVARARRINGARTAGVCELGPTVRPDNHAPPFNLVVEECHALPPLASRIDWIFVEDFFFDLGGGLG